MAKFTDCVKEAFKSLADVSVAELESYVKKTLNNAKKTGLSGKAAINAAKDTTYDQVLSEVGSDAIRIKNTALNMKKLKNRSLIRNLQLVIF